MLPASRKIYARLVAIAAMFTVLCLSGCSSASPPRAAANKGADTWIATWVTANTDPSDPVMAALTKQIIAQTHARNLKIFGATILPFKVFMVWTEKGESTRVAANRWITESHAFDGVIDFSAVLTDPANPAKLAAQCDSGDHLHPSSTDHGITR